MSTSQEPVVRQSELPMYLIENLRDEAGAGSRNTIGGHPVLPAGESWPLCYCGERMVLFFQLDIPADIPAFGGDHLLVFQCPTHNDAACLKEMQEQLPERYWEAPQIWQHPGAFWRILLHRDETGPADDVEPHLRPYQLALLPDAETLTIWRPAEVSDDAFGEHGIGRQEFKVGGAPSWAQDPESYQCACGARLTFLCQIPENFGFEKRPDQPEQPDTFNSDQYGLFLGNEVYVLACPARCHPAAAWPVNQN
ncbi:hypothetical protein [Amycolatopsis sp. NPDC098790]|uniref:hypothetical protein n=1 Tax=Amycolatopsis sp. NPDC098790 TaxID=3363939 RepID=UPI003805D59D